MEESELESKQRDELLFLMGCGAARTQEGPHHHQNDDERSDRDDDDDDQDVVLTGASDTRFT